MHGRAEERLAEIADGEIALTNTSPPYLDQRFYANGYNYDFPTIAKELYRVTCEGGIVAWNEGLTTRKCDEQPEPYDHVAGFRTAGFKLLSTIIIRKDSIPFPSRYKCGNQFEFLWLFLRGDKPRTFNKAELRDRPNKQAGMKKNAAQGRRGRNDAIATSTRSIVITPLGYRSNVWDVPVGFNKSTKDHDAHQHPAIQSEVISDSLIRAYSKPTDTVLDLFSGSGTTLKMACLNSRPAVGIERSREYVLLSAKRLRHYTQDVVIC